MAKTLPTNLRSNSKMKKQNGAFWWCGFIILNAIQESTVQKRPSLLDLFQDLCIANKRLILSDWCSLIEIVFNLMRFNKDQSQKAKRAANTSFISLLVISIQPTPKPSATDRNKSKCLFCCSLFVDNDAFPVATMMLCLFADDHDASPFLSIVAMLLKTWAHILVLSVIGIL